MPICTDGVDISDDECSEAEHKLESNRPKEEMESIGNDLTNNQLKNCEQGDDVITIHVNKTENGSFNIEVDKLPTDVESEGNPLAESTPSETPSKELDSKGSSPRGNGLDDNTLSDAVCDKKILIQSERSESKCHVHNVKRSTQDIRVHTQKI